MAVYKRKDREAWEVSVYVHGRRIRESYPTRAEARQREKGILAQSLAPVDDNSEDDMTLADFAEIYLKHARATKAPKTVYNETWALRSNIMPFMGKVKLSKLATAVVERYKVHRLSQCVSNRSVNIDLQLISVMLKLAKRLGFPTGQPEIERLNEDRRPPEYLKQDEVNRFIREARQTYAYTMLVCALSTGMRKAELCNLEWSDIDFAANTIIIRSKDDWKTKNRRFRIVEMISLLRDALLTEYERRDPRLTYVFTWKGKKHQGDVRKTMDRIARQAGIPKARLHMLRHTFSSHLAMQGVPIRHLQELLGHSDINTTMIYAHVSAESHRGQVHRLPYNPDEESE